MYYRSTSNEMFTVFPFLAKVQCPIFVINCDLVSKLPESLDQLFISRQISRLNASQCVGHRQEKGGRPDNNDAISLIPFLSYAFKALFLLREFSAKL